MKPFRRPIAADVPRLRQRQRASGTWRLWWEPEADAKALGFGVVELDENKLTWSVKQAEALNREVARARETGQRVAPIGARSMSALIEAYLLSRLFLDRAEKTKADYARRLRAIDVKWGEHMVTEFSKPVMRQWYETLHATAGPSEAVHMLRMMSIVFSFAELKGWRDDGSNPCQRLKMSTPVGRSRAASWAEFDALLAAADAAGQDALACAIALSALQGARQTDVRLARCDGFRFVASPAGGPDPAAPALIWTLRRSKRGNMGTMIVHPDARPRVQAMLDRAKPGQDLLLLDADTGAGWSEFLIGKRFAAIRDAAARVVPSVASLQFRDLRRTFGVWSRAGGSSKADVGDVLGNSVSTNPQLAETYMPATFETASRAVLAIVRPETKERKTG